MCIALSLACQGKSMACQMAGGGVVGDSLPLSQLRMVGLVLTMVS